MKPGVFRSLSESRGWGGGRHILRRMFPQWRCEEMRRGGAGRGPSGTGNLPPGSTMREIRPRGCQSASAPPDAPALRPPLHPYRLAGRSFMISRRGGGEWGGFASLGCLLSSACVFCVCGCVRMCVWACVHVCVTVGASVSHLQLYSIHCSQVTHRVHSHPNQTMSLSPNIPPPRVSEKEWRRDTWSCEIPAPRSPYILSIFKCFLFKNMHFLAK